MAIDMEIKSILGNLKSVEDHTILDHTLATLVQLSWSLASHARNQNLEDEIEFEIKDHFAPSQNYEKQLVFQRNTKSAGRKKNNLWLSVYSYVIYNFQN